MLRSRALPVPLLLAAVVATSGFVGLEPDPSPARIPLHSEAAVLDPGGSVRLVPAGEAVRTYHGTRVQVPEAEEDRAAARALARDQRAWLAAGRVPGTGGPWEDLVRSALLDLDTLLQPGGAAVAGWSPAWRHVWPRDAAFVAAALAAAGHQGDAEEVLRFVQSVQEPDGGFAARYLLDGSGPPDGRPRQLDSAGWALWGTLRVVRAAEDPPRVLAGLRPLVDGAAQHLRDSLHGRAALPRVSPDYWEVRESRLTLGTAAPVLVGLESAAELYALADEPALAAEVSREAARLAAAVRRHFGPGYPRHLGGRERDTAVGFLLPPYRSGVRPDVLEAWYAAAAEMRRPAGGLAPGGGWRRDGVSWTPTTAAFAWNAAAVGDEATATRLLDWLDAHRTTMGALPEKVLADGSPAEVAPLAWTSALVVLAVAQLDGMSTESMR